MMESKIILFCLLHLLLCFIFYCCIRQHSRFQVWSECSIVFLIPGFGLIFIAMAKFVTLLRRKGKIYDVYLRLKNDRAILGGQLQTQADIIPLNDALFIEHVKEKRGLLTTAIKQNILENGKILRLAIKDTDREVAHYAVAMLLNQVEKVEAELFSLEREMAQKGENREILRVYASRMKTYLDFEFLDQVSQRKKEENYIRLMEKILLDGGDEALHVEYVDFLIRFERFVQAEQACADFLAAYPGAEKPYLCYIKLYTQMKRLSAQQQKIAELKALPIQLSVKALEVIRFWAAREGEHHVQ